MSAGSLDRFDASVVELLDLEWGEVVDRAVGAFGVEPQHPGRSRRFDLVDVPPRAVVVDELGLVKPDLRFRERVVVGVADAADGRVDALVEEPVGEGDRRVDTGLNRWKQHLIGGCCGKTIELDEGSDRASADAVPWRALVPAREGA